MGLLHKFDCQAIDQAIEKGIKYLLSLTVNGRWRGFPTMAGESDIWVTGFVLAHIYTLCKKEDIEESQNFLLKSRHLSGGWSYSDLVPPDADSSAWCLLALKSCTDLKGIDLEKAKLFLWSHFKEGGVSTYSVESGIREFISATNNEMISGWTSAHPDVSIAAVLADIKNEKVKGILNWLINQQTSEGLIDSYWWRSQFYTTTLLLRALSKHQHPLTDEHAKKIAGALLSQQLEDGSFGLDSSTNPDSFTTSLALESFVHLSYLGNDQEKTLCGNALMQFQQQDGSWAGSFILRIPAPNIKDPNQINSWNSTHGGGNSFVKDQDGIFATAMACYALHCWKQTDSQENFGSNLKTTTI